MILLVVVIIVKSNKFLQKNAYFVELLLFFTM